MLQVLNCLTTEHDWRFVLLAAVVCLTGAATAARLYLHARDLSGRAQAIWLTLTGCAAGAGVWATHFIAMLGFEPGLETGYEAAGTLGSLVVAIAGLTGGFALAAAWRRPAGAAASGAVIGAAVAGMHFLGMTAFRTQGVVGWDPVLVVASVILGMAFSAAAVWTLRREAGWRRSLVAAGLLTLGICALHFTAMGAASITPQEGLAAPEAMFSKPVMAIATAGLSALILLGAMLVCVLDGWNRRTALGRLHEALEAMPDGLAFYDSHDRLVLWNARYGQINPEIADLLRPGTPFVDILRTGLDKGHYPEAVGREDAWLEERLEARRQASCTLEQQTADGRWLRIQDRRAADGTVTVVVDVTDLKQAAEALVRARDSAEAANRAKSEFLANMSHEIRTPLNGVLGVSEALARTELTDEQREMLALVASSGVTLQQLLSDILDLARVESGRLEIRAQPFDLARAIREAGQLYAAPARAKGLQFFVEAAPETQLFVSGDLVRLKQILTNLVSNAVKFTEHGFVRLTATRAADRNGAAAFRFTVEDTGVGFDASCKDRLFGRFEQADGSITRRFGGSGLGLAICRQLAELMGGELDCESEPGGGSAFILTLPLPESAEPCEPETPELFEGETRPLRVLLADDHPTNRRVIELMLGQANIELVSVENGAQAVEAFDQADFDAVLMDMQMPVMDGLSATRALRDLESAAGRARTPVVMLTANALPEHVEAARAAGADRHLAKPINAGLLLTTLAELAEAQAQARAAA